MFLRKFFKRRHNVSETFLLFSDFVGKCIGEEAKYEGIRFLFDGLQQPLLNKQVTTATTTHQTQS